MKGRSKVSGKGSKARKPKCAKVQEPQRIEAGDPHHCFRCW